MNDLNTLLFFNENPEPPRVDAAVEPYPNRWTHHILVSSIDEIDDELLSWIKETSDFSANKR